MARSPAGARASTRAKRARAPTAAPSAGTRARRAPAPGPAAARPPVHVHAAPRAALCQQVGRDRLGALAHHIWVERRRQRRPRARRDAHRGVRAQQAGGLAGVRRGVRVAARRRREEGAHDAGRVPAAAGARAAAGSGRGSGGAVRRGPAAADGAAASGAPAAPLARFHPLSPPPLAPSGEARCGAAAAPEEVWVGHEDRRVAVGHVRGRVKGVELDACGKRGGRSSAWRVRTSAQK
jgi:hypothetical protein